MVAVLTEDQWTRVREIAHTIFREPFTKRTWSELVFFSLGVPVACLGLAFVALTMAAGLVLAITFVGLALIAFSVLGARVIGGFQRGLARALLNEEIEDPPSFYSRPGFLGWLQTAVRDRTGWRAIAYLLIKVPLSVAGVYAAFSVWWDAFACLTDPLWRGNGRPAEFGLVRDLFPPGFFSIGTAGFFHGVWVFATGVILVFVAPWGVRVVVSLDRLLIQAFLAPDAVTVRMRSLEQARAETVDASAATLRRIERDLHDGTQAQLVAIAMRLGMAKEKLADADQPDLQQVRRLVDEAHKGAKEAIVELRDLARGIHPPALDVGLEGALSTLAARSAVPTEVTISLEDRPTAAIEAIAYFCVAELLANVAQHAYASRATVTCAQHGRWMRLVVRDDGKGGAQPSAMGSSSSGLAGLTDRVRTVDGRLDVTSPLRGPTVVVVDLPMHA